MGPDKEMGVTKQWRRTRDGSACICAIAQPADTDFDKLLYTACYPISARIDSLISPTRKSDPQTTINPSGGVIRKASSKASPAFSMRITSRWDDSAIALGSAARGLAVLVTMT